MESLLCKAGESWPKKCRLEAGRQTEIRTKGHLGADGAREMRMRRLAEWEARVWARVRLLGKKLSLLLFYSSRACCSLVVSKDTATNLHPPLAVPAAKAKGGASGARQLGQLQQAASAGEASQSESDKTNRLAPQALALRLSLCLSHESPGLTFQSDWKATKLY